MLGNFGSNNLMWVLVLLLWLLFSNRKRKSTRGEKHETH